MNPDRLRQVGKGLASMAALLVLVVGPPLLLVSAIGWPLPTSIPNPSEIKSALSFGVEHGTVLKALALVGWVTWAWLATSIVLEVLAKVRGHAARALPGPSGIQSMVGRLVATATLAVTSMGPAHAGSTVALPAITLAAVVDAAPEPGPPAAVVGQAAGHPATTSPPEAAAVSVARTTTIDAAPSLVVGRHDSYWAIAERTLGDPLRWAEIRDLNVGRTMPDGSTVPATSEHPQPGWVLLLPADAERADGAAGRQPAPQPTDPSCSLPAEARADVGPLASSSAAQSAGAPGHGSVEVTVQRGDDMWGLAKRHLAAVSGRPADPAEVAQYWLTFVEANRSRLADPGDPNLIYPDQVLVLPAIGDGTGPMTEPTASTEPISETGEALPPNDDGESQRSGGPAQPSGDVAGDAISLPEGNGGQPAGDQDEAALPPGDDGTGSAPGGNGNAEPPAEDDTSSSVPVPVVGVTVATALAVGVLETVRRRRRRWMHSHPGSVPAPTGDPAVHYDVAAQAEAGQYQQLRHALDQLAAGVAARRYGCRPRIVQQGPDHLDVLLDQAATPPADGWAADATGRLWSRTPDGLAADRCAVPQPDIVPTTPLLATLGAPDYGGQLYLDLESSPVVALTGDVEIALGVARGWVTELAYAPIAEGVQIVVVGDLGGRLGEFDRVRIETGWERAGSELTAWAEGTRDAIAANGWPNGFVGRSHGVWSDTLIPLLVVSTEPPADPQIVEALTALGPAAAAALVLVGHDVDGALRIECQPEQLELPQLGLSCRPHPVTVELLEDLVDLVGEPAESPADDATALDLAGVSADDAAGQLGEEQVADDDSSPDILVRVLGDITVEGSSAALTPKQTAIVAYLALHPGANSDRLAEALWPSRGGRSHMKRLGNALGECRRGLGPEHLPPAVDGCYKLGPGVAVDADLWDRRVKAAANQPPAVAAQTLGEAVDLVRGPVFTCRSTAQGSYAWVDVENWVAIWEKKITSVGQHLVQLYLDLGQPEQAIEVADHILRAVPTDTATTEMLMRAHAATGDFRAVRRVFESHVNALVYLDLDDPADSTTALFEELRNAPPRKGGDS